MVTVMDDGAEVRVGDCMPSTERGGRDVRIEAIVLRMSSEYEIVVRIKVFRCARTCVSSNGGNRGKQSTTHIQSSPIRIHLFRGLINPPLIHKIAQ